MEMDQNRDDIFNLKLDDYSQGFLAETAKWAKFLSVVGLIGLGIGTIAVIASTLFLRSAFSQAGVDQDFQEFSGAVGTGMTVFTLFIWILVAGLYVYPLITLYRFATRMKSALRNNDQELLISSFSNLKSCFKFLGILTLIILAIYGFIFLLGVLGAVATGL
jgi:uncharacterized membrane protein